MLDTPKIDLSIEGDGEESVPYDVDSVNDVDPFRPDEPDVIDVSSSLIDVADRAHL